MKKKILFLLSIMMMALFIVGCSETKEIEDGKLSVVVSFNPLKEFTEKIGGDKVKVTSLVPDGSEPHDFEPNPKDFETLINSKVFIYNGLNMEPWLDKVSSSIDESKTKLVDSSKGATIININEDEQEHEHEEGGHDHGGDDPHIWLSLREAQVQAENIKNALIEADPENKEYYEANFESFKNELKALDEEYVAKFKEVKNKNFVTGHSAFGYLARDYGLNLKSVTDIFNPGGEPKPKVLEELVKFCNDNNVGVIFSEQSSTSANANALANETGAKVEKIYSLEMKADNMSYLEGMKYNLEKIYSALKSQK